MAASTITAVVLLLCGFGLIISILGYMSFSEAFRDEYAVTTYHMANTAASVVNGDHIEDYLAGGRTEEYRETGAILDDYCDKLHVSLVYVIWVDQSDYSRFVSVFNSVNNTVDNTEYSVWELGHKRQTTNDEYRRKYSLLYSGESTRETVYRYHPNDGSHPHITTMVPVKNEAGETTAILCIQRPMRELTDAVRPYAITIAAAAVLLALLTALFIAFYLRKQVVKPVRQVSEEATRFARENTIGEPMGSISRYREITSLADSISTMETEMVRYIENLTTITAEKERIGTELTLATQIQESMLPNRFPAFPGRTDFDIYATMDPAREVGGDFYNFFLIDDDHLGLVIGDVSGKGVPAALFMMVTSILVSEFCMGGTDPAEILTRLNQRICKHNEAEMFVTVWLGILELSTGRLSAANAGHEFPSIRRAGGGYELIRDKHGFVVGGLPEARYRTYELQLTPGDSLFVYTDGVPEAMDGEHQLFGTERMIAALNGSPDAPPKEILANVRRAVDDFVQEAEQFDDMTMLCLAYKGPKA